MLEDWRQATLRDLVELQRGYDLPSQDRRDGPFPVMGGGGQNGTHAHSNVEGPGIVIGRSGSGFGNAFWCDENFWAHNTSLFVKSFNGNDRRYAFYVLDSIDFTKFNSGGAQPSLNRNFIYSIEVPLPPLPEQRRIAGILRTWDEAIDAASRLIDAKRRRAQAIALRLFETAMHDHDGMIRAKELFAPVSERNRPDLPLLAVLQEGGVVRRDQLDRRVVMPEGGTETYKVIRPGDFIISLRSFQGGLEYSEIEGLVSPAYTVLRAQAEIEPLYYKHFFKSRSFIGRLDKLIFGIRDGKQIAFRDFGDMAIPRPSAAEQKRAVAALNLVEEDLAASETHLEALKRQKRGLMQKLLTGEWRVPAEPAV